MVLLKIKHIGIMSLFLIVFGTMIMSTTFAQTAGPSNPNENVTTAYQLLHSSNNSTINSTISAQTDLSSYKLGDTIVISGHLSNIQGTTAVTIRIFNPSQNLISVKQLLPSSDGSFTTAFPSVLPTWSNSGSYTVVTQYGPYLSTKTTFNFVGQSTDRTIILTTDKPSYSYGNVISISGKVQGNLLQNIPMSISVITSSGNLALTDQLSVGSDGTFATSLTAAGSIWSDSGTYRVVVQYGSADRTTNTTFQFDSTGSSPPVTNIPPSTGSNPPVKLLHTTPSLSNFTTAQKIPKWVKAVFGFYAQGNLSDDDLIQALQFLIKQGIIKVS